MEPIFISRFPGFDVKVYPDRVSYNPLFVAEQIIMAKQIASVSMGIVGTQEITVETTGGKKHKLIVGLNQKPKLRDAILSIIK